MRQWSQGWDIEPHVWLRAPCGVCLRLSFPSAPLACTYSLSLNTRKPLKKIIVFSFDVYRKIFVRHSLCRPVYLGSAELGSGWKIPSRLFLTLFGFPSAAGSGLLEWQSHVILWGAHATCWLVTWGLIYASQQHLGLEQKLIRNVILVPQKFFVIVGDFGFSCVPFVQDSENSISENL